MTLEESKKLHQECQKSGCDLYTFLKDKFPDIKTEDRLKYLSIILNDFLEDYEFDEKSEDRIKDDGYSIVKFKPKKF